MNPAQEQPKTTKFTPEPEQLVFADSYIQVHGSIREAFELIQRDRSIYYSNWRYQEGFTEWLSGYSKTEVLKHVGKWYLLLEKFAEKGSFRHLDMLLQIAREFSPKMEFNNLPVPNIVFTSCKQCVLKEPHECEECKEGTHV